MSTTTSEEARWRVFEQTLASHPRRAVIVALAEVHADVDEDMGAGMRWHLERAHAVVEALPVLTLGEGPMSASNETRSGSELAADAYRHAALLVQLGLDGLQAHGGRSTPVFEALVATLERMALYAQTGTVPGDPLPEHAAEPPAINACAVDESGGVDPEREAAERAAAQRIGTARTNTAAVAAERGVIADFLRRRAFDGALGAETVAVLNAAAGRVERGAV